MSESKAKFLTETERKYFDALAQYNNIKHAAAALGLNPQTLYNWIYNLKKKFAKRMGWINNVIAQKRRAQLIKRVLTVRRPIEMLPDMESDAEDF